MLEKRMFSNPYYPDVRLFLVLIPFISAFNYYLTYSNIQLNGFLVLTFLIDTAQGYLAWLGVRYFILYLDKKLPYEKGPLKRITVQLIVTILIGLLIIILLTELVSWIARGKPAALNFYTTDLFIIGIWFFVVNGIYIGLHYYHESQHAESLRAEMNRAKSTGLMVRQGKHDIRLAFGELAGFYVDGEYVMACPAGSKKYYVDQSLDQLEKTLPAHIFFRLNRQFIIHHQMISGFKRIENGKLLVKLNPHESFPEEVAVSRTKAPAFKSWFRPE